MIPLHPHDPPKVGPFRLLGRLGEDACTRTYLASSKEHPAVALQVVRSSLTSSPSFRSAFARRVETAYDVHSNYVPALASTGLDHAAPWAALQYAGGSSLSSVVQAHGPLPAAALHPLALALAQGLADLHNGYRTHASLSPDGVLLTPNGAVLADPGFEWALTEARTGPPHPDFAAPEYSAAPATDVYAWAAILCWAVGTSAAEREFDRLPLQLRGLVEACLQEDPVLRPASADLVQMLGGPAVPAPWPPDLAAALTRAEAPAAEALAAARKPDKKNRGKTLAFTAGGLALVLIAGIGAVWQLRGGDDETEDVSAGVPDLISPEGCLDGPGLPGPPDEVDDLGAIQAAFSPDGDVLAVDSRELGLSLWDWREGEEIARPLDHPESGSAPTFAPVGCMLAARTHHEFTGEESPHFLATTVDVPSGETTEYMGPQSDRVLDELEQPRTVNGLDFSPSGEQMLVQLRADSSWDRTLPTIGVVDMNTGELTASWGGENTDTVNSARFLDENRVLTGSSLEFEVRDTESGEVQETIRGTSDSGFELTEDRSEMFYIAEDHIVRQDIESGQEVDRFPVPDFHERSGDMEVGYAGGMRVDTELNLLHFWWYVEPPPEERDGRIEDDQVEEHSYLWDLETGEDLAENEDEEFLVRHLAFHPEQEVIAAIDSDRGIELLDPDTFDVIDTLP